MTDIAYKAASVGAGPWRVTAEWDWVWHGSHSDHGAEDCLHAVATVTNDADEAWFGIGSTECGLQGELWIPGIFDRMTAHRCESCCEKVGMPQGDQSPKNIDECRPIAAARIVALGGSTNA